MTRYLKQDVQDIHDEKETSSAAKPSSHILSILSILFLLPCRLQSLEHQRKLKRHLATSRGVETPPSDALQQAPFHPASQRRV